MRFFNLKKPQFVSKDVIRSVFSKKLSAMYCSEVPQYRELTRLVDQTNKGLKDISVASQERHGAIRLGTPEELQKMRQLFDIMGMYPVGYYDLSSSNLPVHATVFRPITVDSLCANPFRIFTSLLRVDLIPNADDVDFVRDILSRRNIFTGDLEELFAIYSKQNGLTESQVDQFLEQSLKCFRWNNQSVVSYDDYQRLQGIHPIVADIAGFRNTHINHLTRHTVDIDTAQALMPKHNLSAKAVIEGPPSRNVPILLRQTSFKALEEPVQFVGESNFTGKHRSRFGEIEQRGCALTPAGMRLYHEIMEKVRATVLPNMDGNNAAQYYDRLATEFRQFPDDLNTLRRQGLIYVTYHLTEKARTTVEDIEALDMEWLIENDYVDFNAVTYEDFLPVSAAGIFGSNLRSEKVAERACDAVDVLELLVENCMNVFDSGSDNELMANGTVSSLLVANSQLKNAGVAESGPAQKMFESVLGQPVADPHALYEKQQSDSIQEVYQYFKMVQQDRAIAPTM